MADALALDTWSGSGVKLSQVIDALSVLRNQSDKRGSHRTAVMTLVAVAPKDEQAYAATNVLRTLGGHHPARILILRPDADRAAELDARATLYTMNYDGFPANFEEIVLSVHGQAARHLDSFVEPFTLSDLPIAVWYVNAIPEPTDPLLEVASAVLLDSRDAADGGQLRSLLGLARRRTVVDLSWIRLGPWRELLTDLFEPVAHREWLAHVDQVEVTGKEGPRLLLGGWLSGRLGLRPAQVALQDSRHVEIRLECRDGGQQATFRVERGDITRTVAAQATLPEGPRPRQIVPLAEDPLGVSLATALTHLRPNPTWEAALASATMFPG